MSENGTPVRHWYTFGTGQILSVSFGNTAFLLLKEEEERKKKLVVVVVVPVYQ
jgi:hypothetical protein